MRVIGIDLSLASTGIATLNWNPREDTMTATADIITTKGKRGDDLLARNQRLAEITEQVREHLTLNTKLVVIESGAFAAVGGSNWDRAGLWWRVVEKITNWQRGYVDIQIATVAPTSLKKWATDRGNADKSDVAVAMARLWPQVDAPSNDAWDALGLAHMGAQHLGWPVPERAHHAVARAKAAWPTNALEAAS